MAALGVALAGNGLGPIFSAPIANRLIDAYGWRTSYVILAVVALVGVGGGALFMVRGPLTPPDPGPSRLRTVTHMTEFRRLYASGFLMSLALFVPFVFIVDYAEARGISGAKAATLISILGAASLTGRLAVGLLGDRITPIQAMLGSFALQPIGYFIWLFSGGTYLLLALFCVLLGLGYGAYVALGPTVAAELFGLAGLGGILGAMFTGAGIGGLIGPIAAGIARDQFGRYEPVIAACIIFTALAWLILRPLGRASTVPSTIELSGESER